MSEAKEETSEVLYQYSLTLEEFSSIPKDQRAALCLVCYAVSEINTLEKTYIFADHDLIGQTAIDAAITIHKNVILRCWSAKLFELSEFFNLKNKYNKTSDKKLIELSKKALTLFEGLKGASGYDTARIMRNEATNHYFLQPAIKNLDHLSEGANLSLFLHEMNGNCFYPIGEEMMFLARLNQLGKSLGSKEEKLKLIQDWMDWNLAASQWGAKVHDLYVKDLLLERYPEKYLVKEEYWFPKVLAGSQDERKSPVFFRKTAP